MLASFDQSVCLMSSWNTPHPATPRTLLSQVLSCQHLCSRPPWLQRAPAQRCRSTTSSCHACSTSRSSRQTSASCQPKIEASAVRSRLTSFLQTCGLSVAAGLLWPALGWAQEGNAGREIVQEAVEGASSGSLTERLTSGVFFLAVITLAIISLGVSHLNFFICQLAYIPRRHPCIYSPLQ